MNFRLHHFAELNGARYVMNLLLVTAFILPLSGIGVAQGQTVDETAQDQVVEGFTEPIRKLDLIPPEPGILASLNVHEGSAVKKDELLGSLDCEVQEVSLEIARSNAANHGRLDSATAERDLRRWRLSKLQTMHKSGNAFEEEVNRAASELTVAEANILAALEQRSADTLEAEHISAMIERRMLRSPFDGVVTRIYHEEKEFVGNNASPVLTVMQLDKLRVTFTVPTSQIARMKVNQSIPVSFPNSGQKATGKIEFISPVSDAESDTVRVKVLIDNAQGKYRCGVRCMLNLAKLQ
jgi:RND family efflux transporter MFP subunit